MVSDILRIKTTIPPVGPGIIARTSVSERLDQGLQSAEGFARKLTLVSAPAGFGKTTLVRSWLAGRENVTAWLSLDEDDNEAERFWVYLVTALQTLDKGIGAGPLEALLSSGSLNRSGSETGALLTPLLNDLFKLNEPVYLVLDDYHLINNPGIHDEVNLFIDNLPSTAHLVVTTRSDPAWKLPRWRARGEVMEVRMRDLKFSQKEAEMLLTGTGKTRLNGSQVASLNDKTEGWVTGLQLAAVSLADSVDPDRFIEGFTGSSRHILHFLSEEVLARQSVSTRDFLFQTSILTRFNASLCDAITGRKDSANVLAALERENLFLIPLDDEGTWYRYHPLFADLLRHNLGQNESGLKETLHKLASKWFMERGEPGEAVRHALFANEFDQAGQILHDYNRQIQGTDLIGLINTALNRLPEELLLKYPMLIVNKALFYLVYEGKDEAASLIESAEKLSYPEPELEQEYAGTLAAVKAYYYIYSGRFSEAIETAARALELLPPDSYYWRMNVAIYSGDARLFSDNPREALSFYREANLNSGKLGGFYLTLTTAFKMATSLYYLGELDQAEELIRKTLRKARTKGLAGVPRVGLLWTLLGEVLREKGQLEEAGHCIERGLYFSEPEKPSLAWNLLYETAYNYSMGNLDAALESCTRINMLHDQSKLPNFITFPAFLWKAKALIRLHDYRAARAALEETGVILKKGMPQPGNLWGALVLARLLIADPAAESDLPAASGLCEAVIETTSANGYLKLLVEAKVVKALHAEKTGNKTEAETSLFEAMVKACPGNIRTVFLDEKEGLSPVYNRLYLNREHHVLNGSAREAAAFLKSFQAELLPAVEKGQSVEPERGPHAPAKELKSRPGDGLSYELVEELTKRELEILGLISQGLSNDEIAGKLFLSQGTVKWHTSNIYGKLGVKGRTAAVALGRKLKLIA